MAMGSQLSIKYLAGLLPKLNLDGYDNYSVASYKKEMFGAGKDDIKKEAKQDNEKKFNRAFYPYKNMINSMKYLGMLNNGRDVDSIGTMILLRDNIKSMIKGSSSRFMNILRGCKDTAIFLERYLEPIDKHSDMTRDMYGYLAEIDTGEKLVKDPSELIIDVFNGEVMKNHWVEHVGYYEVYCDINKGFHVIDKGFAKDNNYSERGSRNTIVRDPNAYKEWLKAETIIL